MHGFTLSRRLFAEFLGTAFLLAVVVGSGIMAQKLFGQNMGLALLANAIATGAGLYALIVVFAPISGAHFNPLVSLAAWHNGQFSFNDCVYYVGAQCLGAVAGVMAAHLMFELPLLSMSQQPRTGIAQYWSEVVASFGLLFVIFSTTRYKPESAPTAIALYITSAYWFTASTSFANPAVTLARAFTNTFAGIRLVDTGGFMITQCIGLGLALMLFGWLQTPKRINVIKQ